MAGEKDKNTESPTSDNNENIPLADRAWNFTKSIAHPAVAGAAGIGIATGVKALWTRASKKTTEQAVASAVRGGGGNSPF